jgi:hypothetical protein
MTYKQVAVAANGELGVGVRLSHYDRTERQV